MENKVDAENITDNPSNGMSPGALLRAARQEKKLDQASVAKQLRLSVQWVKDMENDDYAHAAALTYVRGYLRSYARLLGVSQEAILEAIGAVDLEEEFRRVKSTQETVVLQHSVVPVISRSTRAINGRLVRWVSTVAVSVLVILVALWWQGQRKHVIDQTQSQPSLSLQSQDITPTADIS